MGVTSPPVYYSLRLQSFSHAETFAQAARGSRYLPRRLRRPREAPGICRDVCAGRAGIQAFTETFAQAAQVPRHLLRRLRRLREAPGICRDVCASRAGLPAFAETFAQVAQVPRHLPKRLRDSRKRQKDFRETCGTPANTHYSVKMSVRWRLAFFLTQGAGA